MPIAVVTGSSGGIGHACCKLLSARRAPQQQRHCHRARRCVLTLCCYTRLGPTGDGLDGDRRRPLPRFALRLRLYAHLRRARPVHRRRRGGERRRRRRRRRGGAAAAPPREAADDGGAAAEAAAGAAVVVVVVAHDAPRGLWGRGGRGGGFCWPPARFAASSSARRLPSSWLLLPAAPYPCERGAHSGLAAAGAGRCVGGWTLARSCFTKLSRLTRFPAPPPPLRVAVGSPLPPAPPQVHLLVHNAAEQVVAPLAAISKAAWDSVLSANLSAPFHITRRAPRAFFSHILPSSSIFLKVFIHPCLPVLLPELLAARGGASVVCVASIHASLTKARGDGSFAHRGPPSDSLFSLVSHASPPLSPDFRRTPPPRAAWWRWPRRWRWSSRQW